jgi:nitrite reductase/ring-hydroxylating ferredoxin subunit/uncharacterized membrane protein
MDIEAITNAVSSQAWTEPAAESLANAVSKAFEAAGPTGKAVEDFLHGTWFGHPLHPALTDVPIGAWGAAAALDALEASTGRADLRAGADICIALGLLGALGSAATGLTDWHDTDGKARQVGIVHGLLNGTATLLVTGSLLLRRAGKRAPARGLSWLGYALVVGSAYLGGALVYNKKIGVDHAEREDLPDGFVPVMPVEDLPDERPVRVEVEGKKAMVVRHNGRIYAIAETCAHLGGPLAEGRLDEGSIECPWHGSRYALADGRILQGPSAYAQPVFEVRVRGGKIEVRSAKTAIREAPPVVP